MEESDPPNASSEVVEETIENFTDNGFKDVKNVVEDEYVAEDVEEIAEYT